MKKVYRNLCNPNSGYSGFLRMVVLGIILATLPGARLLATTIGFQSQRSVAVCPTFGGIEYEQSTISYEGQPLSITSIVTGLVPNTSQTFTFTVDGVLQPQVTATSDADGNITDALRKLAIAYAPGMLTLGTHTAVLTSIKIGDCVLNITANNTVTVVVIPAPDLTPVVHTAPTTLYGNSQVSFVVDVFELNNSPTTSSSTRKVKVYINKQEKVDLSFDATATSIGGYSVQNSAWSFDDSSDENYYILTANNIIEAGSKLSFGLTGAFMPGSTSGTMALCSVIAPLSGGEVNNANNTDADSVTYFTK
ncbi:hypothetical protein [Spirosoma sp.]|uniref:hypothetical protein n=1 Tax=Spirosoma sp. TaxID=1899569 RepID=UPI003B3BC699